MFSVNVYHSYAMNNDIIPNFPATGKRLSAQQGLAVAAA